MYKQYSAVAYLRGQGVTSAPGRSIFGAQN